jgi:hypothetical protein
VSAYITIACDAERTPGDRCMAEDSPPGSASRTGTAARTRLRREGWRHTRDGRDICPDCWKAGRR